jgi:protease-4
MWSSNTPFSASSWERMNNLLDHVYADFTGKAEQDRHISAQDMDTLARGRIWPGDEAKRVGLVDDNGGYATAIAAIRELAKLPSQMPVNLVQFPQPKDPLQYLLQAARSGRLPPDLAGGLGFGAKLTRLVVALQSLAGVVWTGDGELTMPPIRVR